MKCEIDIKKAIIEKGIAISETRYAQRTAYNKLFVADNQVFEKNRTSETYAKGLAEAINKVFGNSEIATVYPVESGYNIVIEPSNDLIKTYYDLYLKSLPVTTEAPVIILPTDKIIWGHPTIGKSYLKKNMDNRFISLDDDYSFYIKKEVDAIAEKYNVTPYQVKDGGMQKWNDEYNKMMQSVFNTAKQKALSENKMLFTSNTNLLKNNISSFDKVINIPDQEFFERIKERGEKYNTKEWKQGINEVVSMIPTEKVINTNKYLSEILPAPEQYKMNNIIETVFEEDVVKYLHKINNSRLSLDKYRTTIQGFVVNLKGANYTNEQILEAIKCI